MADAGVRFKLLGPLEVTSGGREVALGGPKQRGLLALLLLRPNEVVPRDRLIDGVWGDSPPDSRYFSEFPWLELGCSDAAWAAG